MITNKSTDYSLICETVPKFSIFWAEFRKAVAFISKDMKISTSYKLQFVFQFLQIFFAVVIVFFIDKMLAESGGSTKLSPYGGSYFAFAVVGIAINSYMRVGLVTVNNDIRQTMNQGVLEAMCATPINYTWLILCSSLWQFIFETFRVACYFAIAMLAFDMRLEHSNWLLGGLIVALTGPIFLLLGVMSCSILIVVKRGDPINWIFSSLGAILAGTMFPISVLPEWLQRVAFWLPLTHSLEAMRKVLLAGADFENVSGHLLALVLFIIVLLPMTVIINSSCMRYAKKKGAFSTH